MLFLGYPVIGLLEQSLSLLLMFSMRPLNAAYAHLISEILVAVGQKFVPNSIGVMRDVEVMSPCI